MRNSLVGGGGPAHPSSYSGRPESISAPTLVARLRAAGCVYAEDEAAALLAAAAGPGRGAPWLEHVVARRVAGAPLEHLLEEVELAGERMAVTAGMFVPRARTRVLVDVARARLPLGGVLLELCCGAAPVATLVGRARPDVTVLAADVDTAAVAVARRNLAGIVGLAGPAEAHAGDLYDALPPRWRGRVDVLVANAPYVPSAAVATMPREAREHEPRVALDGGPDGTAVQQRVVAGAAAWLRPGGFLAVETSRAGAPTLAARFRAHGLVPEVHVDDDVDGTAVVGRLAGARAGQYGDGASSDPAPPGRGRDHGGPERRGGHA
ncbi:methyltransferase [Nocardioides sp. ChNu-99]|uniref:methyltransferase n=1 Tax=Nocardioides sp. ChNu-99 TaxID=2839897 RepID=UPI002404E058|nr:methyltransferase [Nocardioides sp. ChNu-99]MDF9716117.1 methyltransferase [Nocardioides sp. ChNu-99]